MRRALVLTSEGSRHRFRQSLPPHVLRVDPPSAPEGGFRKALQSDDNDWKLFCLSFAAFFTVTYSFIA